VKIRVNPRRIEDTNSADYISPAGRQDVHVRFQEARFYISHIFLLGIIPGSILETLLFQFHRKHAVKKLKLTDKNLLPIYGAEISFCMTENKKKFIFFGNKKRLLLSSLTFICKRDPHGDTETRRTFGSRTRSFSFLSLSYSHKTVPCRVLSEQLAKRS